MVRYSFKSIATQVENINVYCLAGYEHRIKAQRMNGQIYLYKVSAEDPNRVIRFMFGGTARECYLFLYGWTEMYYNWQ